MQYSINGNETVLKLQLNSVDLNKNMHGFQNAVRKTVTSMLPIYLACYYFMKGEQYLDCFSNDFRGNVQTKHPG